LRQTSSDSGDDPISRCVSSYRLADDDAAGPLPASGLDRVSSDADTLTKLPGSTLAKTDWFHTREALNQGPRFVRLAALVGFAHKRMNLPSFLCRTSQFCAAD
jgi:hypothetical protein